MGIKKSIKKIFNKYKIGDKYFWNSPIICDICGLEVDSVSRMWDGQWKCEKCEGDKNVQD